MISSVARVKFIITIAIFRYHTKDVTTKFHQIRITKSKVIHIQIPKPKWKKTTNCEKDFLITKRGNKRITNRGSFRDFKLEQKDCKSGKRDFESWQRLPIGVTGISNQGRDYKAVQNHT